MNGPELVSALGGKWQGHYGMARCPAHSDRTPSLRVEDGKDGRTLLYCYAGCENRDIIGVLRSRGIWNGRGECAPRDPADLERERKQRALDNEQRKKLARALWKKAVDAKGTPAEVYLRERGITIDIPPTIRYLPDAKHSPTGLLLPCMVAQVATWPERKIVGVHRTFLTADGTRKAGVSQNRMMLGCIRGGAVRLAPAAPKVAVAEGIETALSVMQESGLSVWAGLSAGGLESMTLPPLVEEVVICGDNDDAGRRAAKLADARWRGQGRTVRLAFPPGEGEDFNDLLEPDE